MNIFKKSKTTKAIAFVAGAAIGLTMTASAVSAAGLTSSQVDAIVALLESFGADSATINNVQVALTGEGTAVPTPGTCTAYTFSSSLAIGDTGADVKALQVLLNTDVATQVAATGVGSAGEESEYFGSLTKAAVIKFQNIYAADVLTPINLTVGTGYVGSMTLAKLNELSTCTVVDNGDDVDDGDEVVATGPVTVALAVSNPVGGGLIGLQAGAEIAAFEFKGVGTVSSITLKRSGVSDQNALTNVYLYEGNTRLTDGYTFNTDSTITMNNLNLAVNGSRIITVKADVQAAASAFQATLVASLTSFTADSVVNEANVAGGSFYFASGTLAGAVLSGANSPAVNTTATVNAGTVGYTFWSQDLQVNTRALTFSGASFRMIGSAPVDALSNIKLYVDGVDQGVLASVVSIGGVSYIKFDMTAAPLTLATGSRQIDVRATIEKGSARTIQLSLQQAADLTLTDSQMGLNIAVTGTIPVSAGTVSINAGTISTTVDPSFSSVTNVTGGSTGATFAKFKLQAYGEDIKVSSLSVTPVLGTPMTPTAAGLKNVALFYNGSQVGSTQTAWTAGAISFTFGGSSMIVEAGTSGTLEVRADIMTSAGVNYTAGSVSATLNVSTGNGQGQNSSSLINVPTSAITTTSLTTNAGTLILATSPTFVAQQIIANTQEQKIGSFVIQAGSSEAITVNSLTVAMGGTVTLPSLSNLYVKYGTTESTPVAPQATNNFSVNITVQPNTSVTVDVYADVGSVGTVVNTNTPTITAAPTQVNVGPAAATRDITVTGTTNVIGGTFTMTINGNSGSVYTTVGTNETATVIAIGIADAININTNVNGLVTATNPSAGVVRITANTAGAAGNAITLTTAKVITGDSTLSPAPGVSSMSGGSAGTAQIETYTVGASIVTGNVYSVTINGTAVTYTALITDTTPTLVSNGLRAALVAASLPVTGSGTATFIVTANVPGTAFTFTAGTAVAGSRSAVGSTIITTLAMTARGATSATIASVPPFLLGQTMTIALGTLAAPTLVTDSPYSQLVVSPSTGTSMMAATYKFVASVGAAKIQQLKFRIVALDGNTALANTVTSIAVGGQSASVVLVGSDYIADISGLDIDVPVSAIGTTVAVTPTYKFVGTNGAALGTNVRLELTYVKSLTGTTVTETPVITPLNVDSNVMVLAASKPTVTKNAGSPVQSSGYVPDASSEILRFDVTADSAGPVVLSAFTFTPVYTLTGMGTPAATVYDLANPTVAIGTVNIGITGLKKQITFTSPQTISAGMPKTFILKIDTSLASASAAGTSIRADLTATADTASAGTGDWLWNDGTVSGSYTNGFLLKNLSVTGGTLVK